MSYEDDDIWEGSIKLKPAVMVGCVAYTVGQIDRVYGGPEEGGWWYDKFTPLRTFIVPTAKAARVRVLLGRWETRQNAGRRPLHSVLSDGLAVVRPGICGETPRPHYE